MLKIEQKTAIGIFTYFPTKRKVCHYIINSQIELGLILNQVVFEVHFRNGDIFKQGYTLTLSHPNPNEIKSINEVICNQKDYVLFDSKNGNII